MSRPVLTGLLLLVTGQSAAAGTLDYTLSSHGFHLAAIEVRSTLTAQGYAISVHSRTTGLLGALTRSDVTSVSSGRFEDDRPVPLAHQTSGHSRGADRRLRIDYVDGAPLVRELSPPEPDREPVPAADTMGSIDLLSAMAGLVHLAASTGHCRSQALVFDGRRLSRLEAHDGAHESLPPAEGMLFSGPALRCDFVSRQLGGFLRGSDRARTMTPLHGSAWLAAPAPGAPMTAVMAVLESPLFGRATLRLSGRAP